MPAPEFAFDLGSAWTYLAAERVCHLFSAVRWTPVLLPVEPALQRLRHAEIEARAAALRMPLIWPEETASAWRGAMRVASYAAEHGRAGAFVLAAGRLAFCGGFNLDDPEILAEAAAAACLPLDECLRAAGDRERDARMLGAGRAFVAAGADRLPAVQVGHLMFCGEERLLEAAAAARGPAVASSS
jgi:2-hydroxychromene-2-carboxylate isomerase